MARIYPFPGILFNSAAVSDIGAVLCPPYDVITLEDQYRLYLRSPHNMIRLELGQELSDDFAERNRYLRAREQLGKWLATGILQKDDRPYLYLHDHYFAGKCRRALFGAVHLVEWSAGEILPHEQTLDGPKADRLLLLRHTRANLSPLLGLYEDPAGDIASLIAEAASTRPVITANVPGGEQHCLWRITDQAAIARIQATLAQQSIYLADGHHRYETALDYRNERQKSLDECAAPDTIAACSARHYRPQSRSSHSEAIAPWRSTLMALCSLTDPNLVILPTHRLVRLDNFSASAFLQRLTAVFEVQKWPLLSDYTSACAQIEQELAYHQRLHRIAMVLGAEKHFFILTLKAGAQVALSHLPRSAAWCELDVALLHYLVLCDMLGLPESEWRGGKKIVYTRETREVLLGIDSGEFQIGFLLNPTPIGQIREVARAADCMPQKSTYFYPKLPTGLVFRLLDD
ncbi:MAG: DUF1015 domain-containing protein [Cyanobacteria bacterium NC_groundwater_1444_Ag_S-0.65um_54_12]|nr:DUF1015 domain-containing protein [Cyanobacteria bacterium NC_groundwater_1444_Ag_S-0.65um_54_12]